MEPPTFTAAQYFPPRRRVTQACMTCRLRKTRCDAAKPKCSLCSDLGVECVYSDSQQLKIDPNTKMLLDRIQQLEDRLFSTPPPLTTSTIANLPTPATSTSQERDNLRSWQTDPVPSPPHQANTPAGSPATPRTGRAVETDVNILTVPIVHTGTANVVYRWPPVQVLLNEHRMALSAVIDPKPSQITDATDVFFLDPPEPGLSTQAPNTWRLFQDTIPGPGQSLFDQGWDHRARRDSRITTYRNLISAYFVKVNSFFPMLSVNPLLEILSRVIVSEDPLNARAQPVSNAEYCLLLSVLCFAAFASSSKSFIFSTNHGNGKLDHDMEEELRYGDTLVQRCDYSEDQLWNKAKLLLGLITSEQSLECAQCFVLAALYSGAKGRVSDSFSWAHAAAMKCEVIAKRSLINSAEHEAFSDDFRRLFWIVYIYENDFLSEYSFTLPSGITRYEEIVPFPIWESQSHGHAMEIEGVQYPTYSLNASGDVAPQNWHDSRARSEELAAFQVSTNAMIRKFLNRINMVVYDLQEDSKKNHPGYITWLIRITDELRAHHEAIHNSIPEFLMERHTAPPPTSEDSASTSPDDPTQRRKLGNNAWNITRLRSRYDGGSYIINRPFFEYVLLNTAQFEAHPYRSSILEKCRLCLDGCIGSIEIFSIEPSDCITGLFGPGLALFAMLIILMMSTIHPSFESILPSKVEDSIKLGFENLKRFSKSIHEFEWHLNELSKLDRSRKVRMARSLTGLGGSTGGTGGRQHEANSGSRDSGAGGGGSGSNFEPSLATSEAASISFQQARYPQKHSTYRTSLGSQAGETTAATSKNRRYSPYSREDLPRRSISPPRMIP